MQMPEKLKSLTSLWDEDTEKQATTKNRRRYPSASGSRIEAQGHHTPVGMRYYSSFYYDVFWQASFSVVAIIVVLHGAVIQAGIPSLKTRETCSYNFVVAIFDFKLYYWADAENTDPHMSAPHNGSQHKRWC